MAPSILDVVALELGQEPVDGCARRSACGCGIWRCMPHLRRARRCAEKFRPASPTRSTLSRFRCHGRLWQFCRGAGCHGQGRRRGAISARDPAHDSVADEAGSMGIFSEIFSWWGGNTWSNRIYTAARGKLVGTDAAGNRYYVQSKGIGPLGVPRRWVIYQNLARKPRRSRRTGTAGCTTPVDTPPTEEEYTAASLAEAAPHEHDRHARRPIALAAASWPPASGRKATGDYKPWRPS